MTNTFVTLEAGAGGAGSIDAGDFSLVRIYWASFRDITAAARWAGFRVMGTEECRFFEFGEPK